MPNLDFSPDILPVLLTMITHCIHLLSSQVRWWLPWGKTLVTVYAYITYLCEHFLPFVSPTYQADPCGSQGPRHTQQNSALQFWLRHTMWLQPPSFSIVTWHLGHSFVLAAIQLEVSLSSSHFLIHFFNHLHLTGSCQFSPQLKLLSDRRVKRIKSYLL